jgi:uncharacterized protein YkwD
MGRAGLRRALAAVSMVATLAAAPARAAAGPEDAYTAELGRLIDDYRAQHRLQPLAMDARLSELAQAHAMHMAREDRMSHDGFQQRLVAARAPRCVENVGENLRTPQAAFGAWRDSPVHDHNLLDPAITRMGVAIEAGYVAFFACGPRMP